ncbi:MAG: phosphonate ABC transporter, permease protein PhnE [Leptolyngbya sp. SIO3F4]|nr:phosphonate ABC transporter, permease protein PhnE [Leptolyngbya sp. SIO3F4]
MAAVVAAVVAAVSSRKLVIPMLLVAAMSWSANKSELNPSLLVDNRGRAVEYVFGRQLSDVERADLLRQAESTASLGLQRDSERSVMSALGLKRGDQRPDNFAQLVDAESERLRSDISLAEWDLRVGQIAERLAKDRKGGFFPPETNPKSLRMYLDAILETVAIALWGTALAVFCAAIVALLGSERALAILSSGDSSIRRLLRRIGVFFTRRGFDACRGFNEFVLALIFVAIIGLGPFAGVLALSVHTFGVLGKVFADALETVRRGEIEGVSATGAPAMHVVSYAVVPQVLPYMVSQSLLRFESNVRSASVLGLVGAGGIGFLIDAKLKSYQFQEVATMMIMIIVLVSLIDFVCGRVMARLT